MPEILDEYIEKKAAERVEERVAERLEERVAEILEERAIQIAKNIISLGNVSLEDIAKSTGLPLEKVQELAKEQAA